MTVAAGRRGALLDVAVAATGLLYSGLLAVLSFQYTFEARVFALVATSAGVVTASLYLIVSLRRYAILPSDPLLSAAEHDARREERIRLAFVTTLVLASVAFLYLLGLYVFTFAFIVVFLRFFAGHGWRNVLALAVGLTVFNYVMFAIVFDLRFDAVGVLLPRLP